MIITTLTDVIVSTFPPRLVKLKQYCTFHDSRDSSSLEYLSESVVETSECIGVNFPQQFFGALMLFFAHV